MYSVLCRLIKISKIASVTCTSGQVASQIADYNFPVASVFRYIEAVQLFKMVDFNRLFSHTWLILYAPDQYFERKF